MYVLKKNMCLILVELIKYTILRWSISGATAVWFIGSPPDQCYLHHDNQAAMQKQVIDGGGIVRFRRWMKTDKSDDDPTSTSYGIAEPKCAEAAA
jgi:hypothetical protein